MDKRSDPAFSYSRSELFFVVPNNGAMFAYLTNVDRVETVVGIRVHSFELIQSYPAPDAPIPIPNGYAAPAQDSLVARTRLTLCDENKIPRVEDMPCARLSSTHIGNTSRNNGGADLEKDAGPLVPLKLHPVRINLGASKIIQRNPGDGQAILVELFYL